MPAWITSLLRELVPLPISAADSSTIVSTLPCAMLPATPNHTTTRCYSPPEWRPHAQHRLDARPSDLVRAPARAPGRNPSPSHYRRPGGPVAPGRPSLPVEPATAPTGHALRATRYPFPDRRGLPVRIRPIPNAPHSARAPDLEPRHATGTGELRPPSHRPRAVRRRQL